MTRKELEKQISRLKVRVAQLQAAGEDSEGVEQDLLALELKLFGMDDD